MNKLQKSMPTWKNSLIKAEQKFLSIEPEKAKRELGFAAQIFEQNPSLQKCDPVSIINAVVNVARTSITLNPVLKLAYLIPRKNKCVLEFSYVGLIKMLKDEGCINYIEAFIVYEDEEFEFDLTNSMINHKPVYVDTEDEQNKRVVKGCYSRAILPTKEVAYCFMPMWEVDKVRKMSMGADSKFSPWNMWKEEMIKKTVIKRHFKLLIGGNMSDNISNVMSIENENNALTKSYSKPSISNVLVDDEVEETQHIVIEEPEKETTTESESGDLFS